MVADKVRAMIVLEILGKPPEHINTTMKEVVSNLDKEQGITVIRKDIKEPKLIEQKNKEGKQIPGAEEIHTSFAEVELEASELVDLAYIVFKYMPSHVEVISPGEILLRNFDLSSILSGVASKLHQYDAIAKSALIQNQILKGKFQQYIRENPLKGNVKSEKTKKKDGKKKSVKKSGSKKKKARK